MKKRTKIVRQHEIRKRRRQRRQEHAEERRRLARWRNRYPPGIRVIPRKGFRKPNPDPDTVIRIPYTFSLLDDPDAVLKTYQQTELALRIKHKRRIHVDHSNCKRMDLAASILLDTIVVAAERRRKGTPNSLTVEGSASLISGDVNVMLFASGLPHHLGLEIELPPEIKLNTKKFESQYGSASHIVTSRQRNQCATDLTKYFDDCIKTQGFELSDAGRAYLGNLVTEVIGNAEEHSGPWHAIGFYDQRKYGAMGTGECHIVIFNYGKTIYETLIDPSTSNELKLQLHRLSESVLSRGWLARSVSARRNLNEECLWTLYALQDRVSRFYNLPGGQDRGNGTIKMIEFFEQLAGQAPMRMCVLSGGAYILFDGRHRLQTVPRNGEQLKIIAFNDENDLSIAPDSEYVRPVEPYFPGTIVDIRLILDRAVLTGLTAPRG
jgi:uncharacterized protein YaiE (UPF0345 family)